MNGSPLLSQLIDALRCLPGIGKKSAQRAALHLLERDRDGADRLASTLQKAIKHIGHCKSCRTFSETDICECCRNDRRDATLLCVVESPADVSAIEETGYRGQYFVLMGHLSPLDGVGPSDLGLEQLAERARSDEVQEVILATNPTVEGEATAHYIQRMLSHSGIRTTRIAQGVPVGGELEYLDSHTLSQAFRGRREL